MTTDQQARRAGAVPRYFLYGESNADAAFDFIHIEAISDRSERLDWSIDAHIHGSLLQVVLFFTGGVVVTLDETRHTLVAPAAVAIPAGVIHSFEWEPGTAGFVVMIADGQLDSTDMGPWIRAQLFDTGTALPLGRGRISPRRFEALCVELMNEHETVDTGQSATTGWLAQTLLVLLAREAGATHRSESGYSPGLFQDFRRLLENHYDEHRPGQWYAGQLHMSESSLNRLCRTVADATAFDIAQDRLELEARRRLIFTSEPVHRVAGDLGFKDPSYFSRFFRRRTGLAPRTFRRTHQP